jgi:hypothetical protein
MSTWEYIYLAVGTGVFGVAITFAVVLICQYLGFSMLDHLWLLAVPILLSLLLNVTIVEIYRKIKKKH